MNPKNRHNTDFKYCFYGHEFKKEKIDDQEVYDALNSFLKSKAMEFCPLVESGKRLWPGVITAVDAVEKDNGYSRINPNIVFENPL